MFKQRLLNRAQEEQVLEAIRQAEKASTAEVRVHIDRYCKTDPVYKAQNIFIRLGMEQTEQRNGILVYVALNDHKAAIIGDEGISSRLPEDYWSNTFTLMRSHFSEGKIGQGIAAAVEEVGKQLAAFFPPDANDTNELSDDISYG